MRDWDAIDTATSHAEPLTASVIARCVEHVYAVLKQHPRMYVTAGWVEDRGGGFSEHTIAVALRKLFQARRIDHVFELGFQKYAHREDIVAVLHAKDKKRKRNKTDDTTSPIP